MNYFKPKFLNKKYEEEFSRTQRLLSQPYFLAILVLECATVILSLVKHATDDWIMLAFMLLAWIISFLVFKKTSHLFDMAVLIGTGLYHIWALDLISNRFSYLSDDTAFICGYTFGLGHYLVQNSFPRVEYAILFEIIINVAKYIMINDIRTDILVLHILVNLAAIFLRINRAKQERRLYQQLFDSRESLTKFKTFLDNYLPTNIAIFNKKLDNVLFANEAFKKEFVSQKNGIDILKKLVEDQEDNNESIHCNTLLAKSLYSKIESFDFSNEHACKDCKKRFIFIDENNSKIPYLVKVFPFVWDGQESIAIVLTNLKDQQEIISLKTQNADKEMAIANVSHELRNPVNGLLGIAQLIEKQTEDPVILDTISLFKTNGQLLLNILNSMLDHQQIHANKLKVNISKVAIHDILHNVQGLFKAQCLQKKLDLNIQINPQVPKKIYTDKGRLSQILINLCANALKFTFQGGITIGVTNDMDPRYLSFWVSDTGIGIDQEDLKSLFKAFGTLESSSSLNKQGVGLGLHISNTLVKVLNKGDIDSQIFVESEIEKGTTFSFKLFKNYENPDDTISSENDSENMEGIHLEEKKLDDHENMQFFKRVSNPDSESLYAPSISSRNSKTNFIQKEINLAFEFSETSSAPLRKKRIVLLVDDNPFNLIIAQQFLHGKDFDTILAYNGKEAIKQVERLLFEQTPPCMIFMDCEMPVMNGLDATSFLRNQMNIDIPIIGLSGNDTKDAKKKCMQAGMVDYIQKPLLEQELSKILRKYDCL